MPYTYAIIGRAGERTHNRVIVYPFQRKNEAVAYQAAHFPTIGPSKVVTMQSRAYRRANAELKRKEVV